MKTTTAGLIELTEKIERLQESKARRVSQAAHPLTAVEREREYDDAIRPLMVERMLILVDQGSLDLPAESVRELTRMARR